MSILVSLPDGVLQLVLKRVPLKDRLTSCALVSRRMHAAANAVEELQVFPGAWLGKVPPATLLTWISNCAHHLTKLEMSAFAHTLEQSPCQHLQDLRLEFGCSVRLAPATGHLLGFIEGCTNLTRLELRCDISGSVGILSNLVHMQHLDIAPMATAGSLQSVQGLSFATLQCMKHLTYLSVRSLSKENLAQLGGLTNLQDFTVCNSTGHKDSFTVGPSSVPGLLLPASLTRLALLSPVEAGLLSLAPTELQALHVECEVEGASSWSNSLLSGIAQLQQLTQLHLHTPARFDWPPVSPAYSALTASSKLAHLALYGSEPPGSIWQYLFSATRKLPHLTSLLTNYAWGADVRQVAVWGAADLSSLVSCCPNLCAADRLHVQSGRLVSQLQQLTALTSISIRYASTEVTSLGVGAAAAAVAACMLGR